MMKQSTSADYSVNVQDHTPVFEGWNSEQNSNLVDVKQEDFEEPRGQKFVEPIIEQEKTKKRGNTRTKTITTCEVCGLVLYHPSKIKEHMRTHTGEKPFQCDICGARFSQRSPMINHFREHMGDHPYSCSFGCGKRFVNNSRKNAHELRHLGMSRTGPPRPHLKPPRRLLCPPLVDDVPRSENLSNSAVANYISGLNFAEETSSNIIPDEQETMMDHVGPGSKTDGTVLIDTTVSKEKKNHPDSNTRIDDVIESVLSRCLAPTMNESPKAIEKPDTPPKRKYNSKRPVTVAQCTVCGLMIKHPSKIAEHVRTHTGEKPFQCGECGLCLTKATSLKIHIRRMHTNYRPFACEWECGMGFVSEACKREHEKTVHSGLKRYECLIEGCSAAFSRRVYMMNHRRLFHNDVFSEVFNDAQVSNEEAADVVLHDDHNGMIIYENDGDLLMLNDNDRIIGEAFDEEEFAKQAMTAK